MQIYFILKGSQVWTKLYFQVNLRKTPTSEEQRTTSYEKPFVLQSKKSKDIFALAYGI